MAHQVCLWSDGPGGREWMEALASCAHLLHFAEPGHSPHTPLCRGHIFFSLYPLCPWPLACECFPVIHLFSKYKSSSCWVPGPVLALKTLRQNVSPSLQGGEGLPYSLKGKHTGNYKVLTVSFVIQGGRGSHGDSETMN